MGEIRLRRPTEADHARLVDLVDEWWAGRQIHQLLPRLWFQHFTGTSWIAEGDDGRLLGFLIGFVSPDDPSTAYVHMVGTDPNRRRRGLGRELYERFAADVAERGVRRLMAVTWPANRVSVAFHVGLGFEPVRGPGTQNLYGTPAFADYDGDGEDRVVFERRLSHSEN
jgi:ribosomal protein S18 acetylase RimI-like enzyme